MTRARTHRRRQQQQQQHQQQQQQSHDDDDDHTHHPLTPCSLIYELLDEIVDFGYPQNTSPEMLKTYAHNP